MNHLYHYYDIVTINYTTTIHYDIATIPTTSPLRIPTPASLSHIDSLIIC